MGGTGKRYIVIIKIVENRPEEQKRPATAAISIAKKCKGIGGQDSAIAFTSFDMTSFGFFIRSDKAIQLIRAAIADHLRNTDSMMVIEIGDEFDCINAGTAVAWLQHH